MENPLQKVTRLLRMNIWEPDAFTHDEKLEIFRTVDFLQNDYWKLQREMKDLKEKLNERNAKLHSLSVELAKAKKLGTNASNRDNA